MNDQPTTKRVDVDLLPEDHWQVGREVRQVITRRKEYPNDVVYEAGFEPWPNARGVITKIARKYVTVHWGGEGIHEHDEQFFKSTGRSPVQHGLFGIVYPGDMPIALPEDSLPPICCRCNTRHEPVAVFG